MTKYSSDSVSISGSVIGLLYSLGTLSGNSYAWGVKDFDRIKKGLNADQRTAVESIEGPVMVVAGPGSGKTQTVALRIAQILQTTHAQATNILALTFTEAGVTALRSRLTEIIGPLAYRVTINTFHGFANEVIGTFPHIFSLTRNLTQLDELERLLIVERLVTKNTTLKLLRPLRQETRHVRDIAAAIRIAKQEAVTIDQIRTFAKKLNKEPAKKSKVEQDKITRQSGILAEFADVYGAYQAELTKKTVYDYEDMILFVLDALQDNAEVKAYFQERYQYILVDEYQDTNNAQNKLVEILADFFDRPNLFVVGDDKQAIYRFQGASVANMLHFYRRYPELKVITLDKNYRSTPEILTAADALIINNAHQLATDLPGVGLTLAPTQAPGPKPELLVAATKLAEQQTIINKLLDFHQRGVAWDQMAVLFRTNAEANEFRDMAEKTGVVVAGVQSADLFREKEIQLLLQMLRAVIRPTDDVAMAATLRAQLGAGHVIELIALLKAARDNRQKLIIVAAAASPAVKLITDMILDWHAAVDKYTLPEILETVLYEGGILESVRKQPNHCSGLELIAALVSNAREFSKRHQTAGLSDWLDYLELHSTYGLPFSVNRSRAELNGVFINTVHQAKGMEYDVVVIPNATDQAWKVKPERSVVKIPAELLGFEKLVGDDLEDLRRLFYVAMTRAKKYLVISYAETNGDGRDQLPSQLVEEIRPHLAVTTLAPNEKELSSFTAAQLSPLPDEKLTATELAFIRERVSKSAFSFTAYWDYKTCPRTYLLKHIYHLPTPFKPSLVLGDAIHKALELFSREHKAFKKLPTKSKLLGHFTDALTKDLPYGDREAEMSKGLEVLGSYYDEKLALAPPPLDVEYSFRQHQVMLDNIWLTGKIDRIEALDRVTKAVRIIDFKTGSQSRTRNYIEGNTQDSDGKYKAQLVFYALLSQIDPHFPYQAKEFEIRFVDDKKSFRSESFVIGRDEIKSLQEDIKKSFAEILTRPDFPIGDPESEVALLFPSLG